ncbi:hypothetical protein GCM10009573_15630 [Agromyces bracchium]
MSDLDSESVSAGRAVRLREGDFYSALCSNEATKLAIEREVDGEMVAFDFADRYVFREQGGLMPLEVSRLNNGLGASVLAITSDDRLVVTLQSTHAQAGAGLWAPSGSGALEPRDLDAAASRELGEAFAAGVARELNEETRIPTSAFGRVTLVGYGRWLDRGGKPELFGVVPVNLPHDDRLMPKPTSRIHAIGSDERNWTRRVDYVQLDLGAPVRRPSSSSNRRRKRRPMWRDTGLVPDLGPLESGISVPLDMALDALARQLAADPSLMATARAS